MDFKQHFCDGCRDRHICAAHKVSLGLYSLYHGVNGWDCDKYYEAKQRWREERDAWRVENHLPDFLFSVGLTCHERRVKFRFDKYGEAVYVIAGLDKTRTHLGSLRGDWQECDEGKCKAIAPEYYAEMFYNIITGRKVYQMEFDNSFESGESEYSAWKLEWTTNDKLPFWGNEGEAVVYSDADVVMTASVNERPRVFNLCQLDIQAGGLSSHTEGTAEEVKHWFATAVYNRLLQGIITYNVRTVSA